MEGRRWAARIALVVCSVLPLEGCYLGERPLTYPSPQPVGSYHFVDPGEFHLGENAAADLTNCRVGEMVVGTGPTRNSVAFSAGGADLCFYSPEAGEAPVTNKNPPGDRLESRHACIMGPFGVTLTRGPVAFRIYVSGDGVALNQPRATLEVNEQSSTVAAKVQYSPLAGGFDELPASLKQSAKPINPAARNSRFFLYTIPRWELLFRFDKPCDPDAHYRLIITGITVHGSEVQLPPVDFYPYREWRPIMVD